MKFNFFLFKKMELNTNNKLYFTIIIFMIPPIVLSSIILSVKIKTANLESIISSHEQFSSLCYNQTYSFIKEQESDERYLSLHSYLKSFTPVCIVIIITCFIKIILDAWLATLFDEDMTDELDFIIYVFFVLPARILSFIPLIVCIILLYVRRKTENCDAFMNYYELCSPIYGDIFENNFNNIMNIRIYNLCILILFIVEIVYHAIIIVYIYKHEDD